MATLTLSCGQSAPAPETAGSPCERSADWPFHVMSARYPFVVHYQETGDADTARRVVALVERAWRIEVEELGFRPPPDDRGACGPDGGFDIFLWRGARSSYVDGIGENERTPHDDWLTYMVVDAWGPYGGELLAPTVSHELNHALQAADDWWESPAFLEMTSTFVEELLHPGSTARFNIWDDLQKHPDWSPFHYDDYETWYMYGAGLYLHMLQKRYFAQDPRFVARAWLHSRNTGGTDKPDFVAGLSHVLAAGPGITLADSVAEFARWRWYTGTRHQAAYLDQGASIPAPALEKTVVGGPDPVIARAAPMMLGTIYVQVLHAPGGPNRLAVDVESPRRDVRWAVQAAPDTPDQERERGTDAVLDLERFGQRTLIITALPGPDHAPDPEDSRRIPVTVTLTPL